VAAALLASAVVCPAVEPPAGVWMTAADRDARIEWRDTWHETVDASLKRWKQELEGELDAKRRLAIRRLLLTARLEEKFPDDAESIRRGFAYALVLQERIDDDLAWTVFAAETVLSRRDRLPPELELVTRAQRALVAVHRRRGELFEAHRRLDELATATERDATWKLDEAHLYAAAGMVEGAKQRLEALIESLPEEGDDRVAPQQALAQLYQQRAPSAIAPLYPGDPTLLAAWRAIATGGVEPARLEKVIALAAAQPMLVERDDGTRVSLWKALVDVRGGLSSTPLAKARALRRAGSADRLDKAMRSFRERPWSNGAHADLVALAERHLVRGESSLALRCCDDVLAFSADAATRGRALLGRCFAVAQLGDVARLEGDLAILASAENTRPPAGFASIDALRERLVETARAVASAEESGGDGVGEVDGAVVRPPPEVRFWPAEALDVVNDGERIWRPRQALALSAAEENAVVAGPEGIAVFERDGAVRWTRQAAAVERQQRDGREWQRARDRILTDAFRPEIYGDRVISRWGFDRVARRAAAITAFDAATGEIAWSTLRDSAQDDLWPISDPVAADGRVFALASSGGLFANVWLVALDAADGRLLWRAPIASGSSHLAMVEDWRIETTRFGGVCVLDEGAVYCAANIGWVARVDARDGLVEWVRGYERLVPHRYDWQIVADRPTAVPAVRDGVVVFAPRDTAGAFGLDAQTGAVVWSDPFLPSDHLAVTASGHAVFSDDRMVVAARVDTGATQWHRQFATGVRGSPAVVGDRVFVAGPESWTELDGATGEERGQRRFATPGEWRDIAAHDDGLVAWTDEPSPAGESTESPEDVASQKPAEGGAWPRLPLEHVVRLERAHGRWIESGKKSSATSALFLLSAQGLERLDPSRPGTALWRRRIDWSWREAYRVGDVIAVVFSRRVAAYEVESGRCRWDTPVEFEIERYAVSAPWVAVGQHGGPYQGRDPVAVIDLRDGAQRWERQLDFDFENWVFHGFGKKRDGRLHLLGTADWRGDDAAVDIAVRSDDGRIVDAVQFLGKKGWPKPTWSLVGDVFMAVSGDHLERTSFSEDGRDYRVRLHGDKQRRLQREARLRVRDGSPWVEVRLKDRGRTERFQRWIAHRDRSDVLFRDAAADAVIRGDRLYEIDEGVLTVIDLPRREEHARYELVEDDTFADADWWKRRQRANKKHRGGWRILDVREAGGRIVVTSLWLRTEMDRRTNVPERGTRIDVFDAGSLRSLGYQILPDTICERGTVVRWIDGRLWLLRADGLDVWEGRREEDSPQSHRGHREEENRAEDKTPTRE